MPVELPTRPLRIALGPIAVRLLVVLLVAIQVLGSYHVVSSGFVQSYWFVDYDHGFVRRGLAGTLVGDGPTAIRIAVAATALLPVCAIVALLELLVRRMTASAVSMAVLLACSPFVVDELLVHRRPDQFGLVVLVLIGAACVYLRGRALTAAVAVLGLLSAALVFVHEGSLLFFGVFAVPVIFLTVERTPSGRARLAAAAVGPALVAAAVVYQFGAVDVDTSAALRADAGISGPTVFRFLSEDLAESWDHVLSVGLAKHLTQLTIGGVLLGAHALWIRSWVRDCRPRATPSVPWGIAIAAGLTATVLFTFATGMDWMRWFAVFGTSALVVVAMCVLADARRAAPERRVSIGVAQILAALYLASLTPIPEFEPIVPIPDRTLLELPLRPIGL